MLFDRLAIYGVPLAAGLVTALVLLGPSRERAVVGARVRGLPAAGAIEVGLRLETLRHLGGEHAVVDAPEVRVAIAQGPARGEWRGGTDAGGFAEAVVPLSAPLSPGAATLTVELGRTVVATEVTVAAPLPVREGPSFHGDDTPAISIVVPRGRLVPPFPERVVVVATPPPGGAPQPTLKVHAVGGQASVRGGPTGTDHCGTEAGRPWIWVLEVTAEAPAVLLTVDVTTGADTARLEAPLPVVPGLLWVDPDLETLRLRSAIPREAVFVSLADERGRLWGTRVPMRTDDQGFAAGETKLPELAPRSPATLIVSGEASEPEGASAAWPLHPRAGRVDGARMTLLADSLPQAIAAERDRRIAARRPAYGLVLAAALFELFYLWRRGRLARQRLEAHVRASGVEGAEPAAVVDSLPLFWLCLLTGGLTVLFAVLAAVAAWA
jgi:hypothetical protein